MKHISTITWQRIFLFAALFNFTFSIPGLIFPEFTFTLTFGPAMMQSVFGNYYALSFYTIMWAAVLLFGIGYYFVSRDVTKNRGIVWMAVIGKIVFFIFFSYSYFTGRSTLLSFLGGSCDLMFTAVFLLFLWQTRNEPEYR